MKFNRFYIFLCCVTALCLSPRPAAHAANAEESPATYSGHCVTTEGAWCWFADPRALHYENASGTINSSYVGYIDVHGSIKAMQYDFLKQEQTEVLIRSYFQPDDHDNPTFLVLPDERVMVFYSRHTDEPCFYYRVSQQPGDIRTLGAEHKIPTKNNTTYPSPFILSDDPEHFYLCWRGINWHPTIAKFTLPDANDKVQEAWGPYQIVQSTGARPYAKYSSNGKDKIYLTYTTGHPDNEDPNFLYFNFIDINTLQLTDITGKVLSTIADGPFRVTKQSSYVSSYPNTVVDNPSCRDWVWQVEKDKSGNPVIAMVRISSDKNSHDYYYARWTGSEWAKTFLCNGGGHFHQTPNLEKCYSGGMAIDPENPNIVYCSAPIEGENGRVYELVRFTMGEDNQIAAREQITKNSLKNNVRPFILPNSGRSPLRLAWMYGDYYDWIVSSSRPQGYPTGIHCDFPGFDEETDLEKGLAAEEDFGQTAAGENFKVQGGVLVSTAETAYSLPLPEGDAFTISLSPYINPANYQGTILRIGSLSYELDGETMKPVLRSGEGERWESTNVLGTSDCWQQENRGTGGQWYDPTRLQYFNLTLTYADGLLRIYRNGLLDQTVSVRIDTKEPLLLGGFAGWIEDCRIYNRVLSRQEIKALSDTTATYELDAALQNEAALEQLEVPKEITTDLVLPGLTSSGEQIVWTSSNPSLVTTTGLVVFPQETTEVELTASIGQLSRTFEARVLPREIERNLVLSYEFEPAQVREDGTGGRYVEDQSGNGLDARICGSAAIDGTLDLSANTPTGFSTNGYLQAPDGVLENLRSYTFLMRVTPKNLNKAPRLYDFGCNSGNSVFGRASKLTAGVKYQGGTTRMIDSPTALTVGAENWVAFTFDARSRTTAIYLNGRKTVSGTSITTEPYQVSAGGSDSRNYIGRTQWWDSSVANDNADYCGTMDDFRLYNIALTEEEIQALMTPTSLGETAANPATRTFLANTLLSESEEIQVRSPWDSAEQTLYIFNAQGALLAAHRLPGATASIDAPAAPGTYLLTLQEKTSGKELSQKIIIR